MRVPKSLKVFGMLLILALVFSGCQAAAPAAPAAPVQEAAATEAPAAQAAPAAPAAPAHPPGVGGVPGRTGPGSGRRPKWSCPTAGAWGPRAGG